MRHATALLACAALGVTAGCSSFQPEVGSLNPTACASEGEASTSPYPTAAAAGSQGCAPVDPRCLPDGGYEDTPCDRCEGAWCCAVRVACYADPGCYQADQNLDGCLGDADAGGDASPSDAAVTSGASCWNAFATSSPLAARRLACLYDWCFAKCSLPADAGAD